MAYRASVRDDDVEPDELSTADVEPFRPRAIEPVEFDPLEEQVMALARTDTLASLQSPGLLERFAKAVFGLDSGRRALADERLEALRRACVVAHHRHHLPDVQAAELREAGFTVAQIRAIELRAIA
jgi:alkylhydroperoxidase family enzyme